MVERVAFAYVCTYVHTYVNTLCVLTSANPTPTSVSKPSDVSEAPDIKDVLGMFVTYLMDPCVHHFVCPCVVY